MTNEPMQRRKFLSRAWQLGLGLIGAAGAWTTWDLLRPFSATGFGGKVRTISPDAVGDTGVTVVTAARAYLARVDGELVALSEKCTHLGCRVPWCDSSSQFECPCHGSVFNRAGEHRAGPAPRGLDRYPVEIGDDGLVYVDTSTKEEGAAPGTESIDEPVTGPSCASEGH